MSNRLSNETSPYLLEHKDNPVDWYPWCNEAFERAKKEDKPIFLSIGYSACHWCHVLAHESFEDEEIAKILNEYFISIKVDKEERPDIDSVYMAVCQAFTGSGGWPTSIFMTAEQKPFFAGTYFPKTSRGGRIGFRELLIAIHEKWVTEREVLLSDSDKVINYLNNSDAVSNISDSDLTDLAVSQYKRIYDEKHGGFGRAPKFPAPHNLLFLLDYYKRYKSVSCLHIAEHTLLSMYRGGMFDHIGFGFCRYSTDRKFLVPHFEKMLYDNALLILAYCKAYTVTKKDIYLDVAEKTAAYILRDMTSAKGGFYSSQDADSEGEEGKYYLFTPSEITKVLGKDSGERFNGHFDITEAGNFEGRNIPNLLKSDPNDKTFEPFFSMLYDYRKKRHSLHRDEKILTSWNSLMIAAMCELYLVSRKEIYLSAAKRADGFIRNYLYENNTLYVSFHMEKRGVRGFLDDYAAYIYAQMALYRVTLDREYFDFAKKLCDKVITDFGDTAGGFYLYSKDHEKLILRPKEIYDGAIPSGNSLMAYNLVRLSFLTDEDKYKAEAQRQLDFLGTSAAQYPSNHAMFLTALLDCNKPPMKITVVMSDNEEKSTLPLDLPHDAIVFLLQNSTEEYPLKNNRITYYVCRGNSCLPPTNDLNELI
ncbi:MAG: thioredoxin domain-containing protein [Clostridia bacterium]|nr:thioredoxin domain-containing protein [Clostridia bacterium]